MRGAVVPVVRALRQAALDVTRVVLPVACPGCGEWDVPWCDGCAALLGPPVRRCEDDVPRLDHLDGSAPLPVWTAATYVGPVRGLVVAWKDRGRADLAPVMLAAVRRAAVHAGPALAAAVGSAALVVVPVPSAAAARRRRGTDVVGALAAGVADELRGVGLDVVLAPVLVRRRGGRDQVGLGARARGRNTTRRVRWRVGAAQPAPGTRYLLVDDVVTTGSTLAGCEDELLAAGGTVLGAIVVAATPSPQITRAPLLARPAED